MSLRLRLAIVTGFEPSQFMALLRRLNGEVRCFLKRAFRWETVVRFGFLLIVFFKSWLGRHMFTITRIAGIEPTHVVLKTTVLPLNYIPLRPKTMFWSVWQSYRTSTDYGWHFKNHFLPSLIGLWGFRSPLLSFFQLIFFLVANKMFLFTTLLKFILPVHAIKELRANIGLYNRSSLSIKASP